MDSATPLWLIILKWSVNVLDVILYPFYWAWFQPANELKRRAEPKRVKVSRVSADQGNFRFEYETIGTDQLIRLSKWHCVFHVFFLF